MIHFCYILVMEGIRFMKNHLKDGFKVFTSYLLAFLVFSVFLIVVLGMTRTTERFYFWLPTYSFLNFLILASAIYNEISRLGRIERRPEYDMNPYPLKGLVIGIIGFIPVALVEAIYPFIHFDDPLLMRIAHAALNTVMGPLYFIIRIGKSTPISYVMASLVVPVLSMLSYLVGYYNIQPKKVFTNIIKDTPKKEDKKGN